jgi:hypothetical protein
MSFDSKLLEIDPETGDLKQSSKKKMGDYLSRRSKAQVEAPVQDPEQPSTVDYPMGQPNEYTYTPPKGNAYPVESDPDEKQQKFAEEYQMARWTFPESLPITRGLMGFMDFGDKEKIGDPKKRKNRGEILKDILTVQDVIPDATDAISMVQNGELPIPDINPLSLAMQTEIGIKLTKNRFSKSINPIERPSTLDASSNGLTVAKTTDSATRADSSSWVSRTKAYRGSQQQSISHRLAANLTPVFLSDSYQRAIMLYDNEGSNSKNLQILKSKLAGNDGRVYSDKNAITKEDVKELESRLESQYVPFYFHDLRTNEILNFHAFVANVSDSYTSNWTDTDGYGRMDPVQTYKNTTRSIALDFYVVSTSEKDFDRVWWTINRLVMMLYPQWSEGNQLEKNKDGESYKFIQPFSQTITSSPIIRLRVGDLIASNYSRFNLARNFGMGLNDTFDPTASEGNVDINNESSDELNNYIKELETSKAGVSINLPVETLLINPASGNKNISVSFASTVNLEQGAGFINVATGLNATITIRRGTLGTVKKGKTRSDGTTILVVELKEPVKINTLVSKALGKRNDGQSDPKTTQIKYVAVNAEVLYSVNSPEAESEKQSERTSQITRSQTLDSLDSQIEEKEAELERKKQLIDNINNVRSQAALRGIVETEEEASAAVFEENSEAEIIREELISLNLERSRLESATNKLLINNIIDSNFSNSSNYLASSAGKGNSIVRSFEDAGGRGLAGSIRSLSFDWNEAPWETSQGSRAPMWCKVSIQFNPIHDLPMGLDHEGMPRAIPYPVGEIVRQAYFPELHAQSSNEKAQQVKDDSKFWDVVGDKAESEINRYLGRSFKRLF